MKFVLYLLLSYYFYTIKCGHIRYNDGHTDANVIKIIKSKAQNEFVKPENPPKYFGIDLDGTFLTDNEDAMNKNFKALEEVQKLGYIPFFCTGRHLDTVFNLLPDNLKQRAIRFCYPGVYCNGSFVYDQYGLKIKGTIGYTNDVIKKIYDYLLSRDLLSSTIFYSQFKGLRCCEYTEEFEAVCKQINLIVSELVDLNGLLNNTILGLSVYSNDDLSDVEIPGLKKGIDYNIVKSSDDKYDIMPFTSNKVYALKILMEHLGEDPSSFGYIGDNHNDVEAMKLSNLSFAVNNADDEVKGEAKYYVNLTNDEAAVAYTLQQVYGITL